MKEFRWFSFCIIPFALVEKGVHVDEIEMMINPLCLMDFSYRPSLPSTSLASQLPFQNYFLAFNHSSPFLSSPNSERFSQFQILTLLLFPFFSYFLSIYKEAEVGIWL